MYKKQIGNIVAIIMMVFLFGMISFVTNLSSPMGDILKNQFKVANWVGTLGVFANYVAYAAMGIPASNMFKRWDYRKTLLTAITIGFVGVGIQTVSGYIDDFFALIVYLLGAFIAGFSMCLLNTIVNTLLCILGSEDKRGMKLIPIGSSFNSLCAPSVIILTGILIPGITESKIADVFPLMYIALAIFALAFVVFSLVDFPEKGKTGAVITNGKSRYSALSFRHFKLGAVAIFLYVGVEVGIPNVLQKWLQNDVDVMKMFEGNVESVAGSIAGAYWFLMWIGRLTAASLTGKAPVNMKSILLCASSAGLLLVLFAMLLPKSMSIDFPVFKDEAGVMFGLARVPVNALLLVLCGLCSSVMWGSIFSLAFEGLGKYTEKASGYIMVMVCGGGILTVLQNAIVDLTGGTGYLTSYWVIIAGLAFLLFYALIGSKNVNKEIPVD